MQQNNFQINAVEKEFVFNLDEGEGVTSNLVGIKLT